METNQGQRRQPECTKQEAKQLKENRAYQYLTKTLSGELQYLINELLEPNETALKQAHKAGFSQAYQKLLLRLDSIVEIVEEHEKDVDAHNKRIEEKRGT